MKIRFGIFFVSIIFLLSYSSFSIGETRVYNGKTLEDIGLTEEDVKYLSEQEIKGLFDSMKVTSPGAVPPGASTESGSIAGMPEGAVNCFDYYKFGSVQVDISSKDQIVEAGRTLSLQGDIINSNTYPIVDGAVYVKIFKLKDGEEKDIDGPDVIDQFFASKNISIPANSSSPVRFEWVVPSYVESGEYAIATFFNSADRFNLLGLTFTDDIIGNTFNFEIKGKSNSVRFDKKKVLLNNTGYHFATYPPVFGRGEKVIISAEIVNTTKNEQIVPVVWKLYAWDALRGDSSAIDSREERVSVPAEGKSEISFVAEDTNNPVYYLVAELKYQDTKSLLGVRFVRDGVDRVRINFPALTDFPLKKDKEVTMFSCLHGMGHSEIINGGKLILSLKDENNKTINSYEYNGPITGAMMGVKNVFTPKTDYDYLALSAELYQNGELVDNVTMHYFCKDIDLSSCREDKWSSFLEISSVIILIIISIIIFMVWNYKRRDKMVVLPPLIIFFFVISGFFGINISKTDARSVEWNQTLSKTFSYWFSYNGGTGWMRALGNPNVTVRYKAEIVNRDTGENVLNNGSVRSGDRLRLSFLPHIYSDVSWFGTGYSSDSPYGSWGNRNDPPPVSCINNDLVGSGIGGGNYNVYTPLIIDLPERSITNINGLSCGSLINEQDGSAYRDCTVTASSGSINPRFNFLATSGKFYYRYKGSDNVCHGNNVALKECLGSACSCWYAGGTMPAGSVACNNNNFISFNLEIPLQSIDFTLNTIARSCVGPDGQAIQHNESRTYYSESLVACGRSCTSGGGNGNGSSEERRCNNGLLSGSYTNPVCSVQSCNSCIGPGGYTIPHNSSRTYYNTSSVSCGQSCGSGEVRTCTNGTLSGSANNLSCVVNQCPRQNSAPGSPSVSGPRELVAGVPGTFSFTAIDPEGDQIRYGVDWDRNGVADNWYPSGTLYINSGLPQSVSHSWSTVGNYTFQVLAQDLSGLNSGWAEYSIRVSQSSATSCLGPDGRLIFNGGNWTYYNTSSVSCGQSCGSGEVRTCTNGTLSGSASSAVCFAETCTGMGWGDWGACSATCGSGTQTRSCRDSAPLSSITCIGESSRSCAESCEFTGPVGGSGSGGSENGGSTGGGTSGGTGNGTGTGSGSLSCADTQTCRSCSLADGGSVSHGGTMSIFTNDTAPCRQCNSLAVSAQCNDGTWYPAGTYYSRCDDISSCPSFNLNSSNNLTVNLSTAGGDATSNTTRITINPINSFSGNVSLTATNLPVAGVIPRFSSETLIYPYNGGTDFSIFIPASVSISTSIQGEITITGTANVDGREVRNSITIPLNATRPRPTYEEF